MLPDLGLKDRLLVMNVSTVAKIYQNGIWEILAGLLKGQEKIPYE